MRQDHQALLHAALVRPLDSCFTAMPDVSLEDLSTSDTFGCVIRQPSSDQSTDLFCDGLSELRGGGYALVILSGGQATRIGTTLPKALLPISPVRRKTLLQLHLERVKRLCTLMGPGCPQPYVFILTSCFNHDTILGYLESVRYFGMDKHRIILFMQGNMPCLRVDSHGYFTSDPGNPQGAEGIGLTSEDNIIVCPNGNGAVFQALAECKEFMSVIGTLKMLHVIAIDNSLSRPLDPELVGLSLRSPGVEVLNKCIVRRENENLGVFCMGKSTCIVEYSEIEKVANASFLSGATTVYGNICDHMFSGTFLRRVIDDCLYQQLPYHVAKKLIPYFDPILQRTIKPDCPNGYKLELFIFDIFQFSKKVLCVEVDRSVQFAPVKYLSDCDAANIQSVQHRMSDVAKGWLNCVGCSVGDGFVDISPNLSYAGEGLERFASSRIDGPVYLELL